MLSKQAQLTSELQTLDVEIEDLAQQVVEAHSALKYDPWGYDDPELIMNSINCMNALMAALAERDERAATLCGLGEVMDRRQFLQSMGFRATAALIG